MGGSRGILIPNSATQSAPRVHGWFRNHMYLWFHVFVCPACAWVVPGEYIASAGGCCLPRVCMGGSRVVTCEEIFELVCPACAWVVPQGLAYPNIRFCLPRVCMGGSGRLAGDSTQGRSAPRVHGWFFLLNNPLRLKKVCPACAWVVPVPTNSWSSSDHSTRYVYSSSRGIDILFCLQFLTKQFCLLLYAYLEM